MKVLISQNDLIGQKQFWHEDEDGNVTIQTSQDVSDVIEANRLQFNQVDERANWKGDLHKIGSIPMSIYYDLKRRGILDDQAALKRWLNDPDNRLFRTRPGQV
jgi:hypothetical protein